MAARSKRYRQASEQVDRAKRYTASEAILLVKSFPHARFNETVEVALRLGIDPKQADQIVRGSVSLPKGIGKDVRVIAFCSGASADAAKLAGAVEAGGEELVQKVQDGWTDFDVAIASPDMMRYVGKLGRILGPQGKMPSPKSGTVTEDVAAAVGEFRAGRIEYRTDATGNLHAPVGRLDFPEEDLRENVEAFIAHVQASRPSATRGTFIEVATLSSSMSPGIRLAL